VSLGDKAMPLMEKLYLIHDLAGFIYPPFWFSMINLNKAKLITTGRNSRSFTLGSLILSSKVPTQKQKPLHLLAVLSTLLSKLATMPLQQASQ